MRILQVVHGFPPRQRAGAEIYTYSLSKELAKRHEVHVFYPVCKTDRAYHLKSFEINGLKIHELPFNFLERITRLISFKSTFINKKVEERFRELLEEIRPDIVHFQHLINLSATLIEAAKSKNIPVIMTIHDYWLICPMIQLLNEEYKICSGPDKNGGKCYRCWNSRQAELLGNYLAKYSIPANLSKQFNIVLNVINKRKKFRDRKKYMKSLLLKVDKLIAPSKFLRSVFVEYGIPENKIVYSDYGYDLGVFKGFKKRKEKNKIVFGFAGGIYRHKGVDILVEAFNKVNNKSVKLQIYGTYNPNSSYFKALMGKIKNRNTKFMGRFEDVKELYSEIDLLVFPSIWYENCPLVLKEAMITCTPVIASSIGAIPEFVKDGENGLLFETGNPDDLATKMRMIIEDPNVMEEFRIGIVNSVGVQAKEIEEIYEEVLE